MAVVRSLLQQFGAKLVERFARCESQFSVHRLLHTGLFHSL
jgi:hypothetical protein